MKSHPQINEKPPEYQWNATQILVKERSPEYVWNVTQILVKRHPIISEKSHNMFVKSHQNTSARSPKY